MFFRFLIFCSIFLFYCCSSNSQTADIDENDQDLFNYLQEKAIQKATGEIVAKLASKMADNKLVLLGESSHGTSEYYTNRFLVSKKLIENHDFSFIAVEGDWTAIYKLNLYVRGMSGYSSGEEIMRTFDRWPEWMWGNREFLELVEWLKEHNDQREFSEQVGLYGMDVYGQWTALEQLQTNLLASGAEYTERALGYLDCFAQYKDDEWTYAGAVARGMASSCEKDLNSLWILLNENYDLSTLEEKNYSAFHLSQKAKVLKNAENHFRLSPIDRAASWNARVLHFWNTVNNLLDFYGPDSKGIAWAHNTHMGDARASIMSTHGQTNMGQLSREFLGEEKVFILGFGTYQGKVNAGSSWGEPMSIMNVPPAIRNSWEHLLNEISNDQFLLFFNNEDRAFPPLLNARGNRAIGVTYNPLQEAGNYVPTLLAHRYDAFWFIGETNELNPIR